jgi:hypothetical protein
MLPCPVAEHAAPSAAADIPRVTTGQYREGFFMTRPRRVSAEARSYLTRGPEEPGNVS